MALAIIFKIFESLFCERMQKCYEKLVENETKLQRSYVDDVAATWSHEDAIDARRVAI